MFIANPFKTNALILLHLLISLNVLVVHSQLQAPCFGSEPKDIPEGCVIVDTKPIIFKGTEDDSTIRQRLKDIKEVRSGIEIEGTDYESFDFFNGTLLVLRNSNGPALTLRNNDKLKRLHFDSLKELEGKDNAILLDKISFTAAAAEDG